MGAIALSRGKVDTRLLGVDGTDLASFACTTAILCIAIAVDE